MITCVRPARGARALAALAPVKRRNSQPQSQRADGTSDGRASSLEMSTRTFGAHWIIVDGLLSPSGSLL